MHRLPRLRERNPTNSSAGTVNVAVLVLDVHHSPFMSAS
jgi:hypothetical protein